MYAYTHTHIYIHAHITRSASRLSVGNSLRQVAAGRLHLGRTVALCAEAAWLTRVWGRAGLGRRHVRLSAHTHGKSSIYLCV
mmetsp:Transcript_22810/g.65244  ORF Transcript_22810/g.65244 Transcript_22810/m.65244 type:complete len:82 (+) Transcript_22810:229-474(+)